MAEVDELLTRDDPESRELIRSSIKTWSREELLRVLLRLHESNDEVRDELKRVHLWRQDPATGVSRFEEDIERALDIDFIDWKAVRGFVRGLEQVLSSVVGFA